MSASWFLAQLLGTPAGEDLQNEKPSAICNCEILLLACIGGDVQTKHVILV